MTDLDQGEIRHERFDLLDDLWLGARVERFELHVEDRLFFRLGGGCLFSCHCVICCGSCGRNGCARCGEGNLLNVQTRLRCYFYFVVCACVAGRMSEKEILESFFC